MAKKKPDLNFWPLLPLILLVACLEGLSYRGAIPEYLAPAPSQVIRALIDDSSELWRALFETFSNALKGFVFSGCAGILCGVIFSVHSKIRLALFPYATFFQTVPIIAIAPLLVIWFGYGSSTVIASTIIVSIFPVIASTLAGIQSTDPALLDLFKIYQASRLQKLWYLQLPSALPQIFVGLRIASGLAVIGAIVGEFIGGGGLGGFIDVARNRQKLDQLFAAVVLASLLGLLILKLVERLANVCLRHPKNE